jgi:hypothetical protein
VVEKESASPKVEPVWTEGGEQGSDILRLQQSGRCLHPQSHSGVALPKVVSLLPVLVEHDCQGLRQVPTRLIPATQRSPKHVLQDSGDLNARVVFAFRMTFVLVQKGESPRTPCERVRTAHTGITKYRKYDSSSPHLQAFSKQLQ